MQYTLEISLSLPRSRVVELMCNPANMPEWQESLIRYEPLRGAPCSEGATAKLIHRLGKRQVEMRETVESVDLPDTLTCVYEAKGAWNRVVNRFVEQGAEQTLWIFETEFRCSGVLRILAFLMPGMFKKASRRDMQRFKAFAESQVAGD